MNMVCGTVLNLICMWMYECCTEFFFGPLTLVPNDGQLVKLIVNVKWCVGKSLLWTVHRYFVVRWYSFVAV
jgi:hypothetical protein